MVNWSKPDKADRCCGFGAARKRQSTLRLAALVGAFLTTACGGGGGGGIGPATAIVNNSLGSQTPNSGTVTGNSGSSGSQTVSGSGTNNSNGGTSGPTFDGSSGSYPSNVSFPVLSSTLQYTSVGASPVTSNQSATATISADSSSVRLIVPSVNLDQTLALSGTPALPTPEGWDQSVVAANPNHDYASAWGLSYVSLGLWLHSGAANSTPQISFTAYAFGYETPASGMPTSGTATYLGPGAVRGLLAISPPIGVDAYHCVDCNFWVSGDASLSVDFASGKVGGGFTNMTNHGDSGILPWYNVSVDGSIAAGTNRFSGSTAISHSNPPGVGYTDGSGRIDGAFYGPKAENLGAIWSLTGTGFTVLGGVAAGR